VSKPREFTQKIRICKGCHNEIHPELPRCIVCGTPNVDTGRHEVVSRPVVPAPAKPAPVATGVRPRTEK